MVICWCNLRSHNIFSVARALFIEYVMMTLEEAIKHCEEKIDNTLCGLEHRQLRDWLIELKEKREA